MAYTSNTGFRYRKHLNSATHSPEPIQLRVANSSTIRVGDLVRVNTGGFAVTSGVSNPVLGVAVGIVDDNGINPFSLVYDTTVTSVTLTGQDQITTSSSNQTLAHYISVEVVLDPGGQILWYNLASAALAQTNLFQFFNLVSNGQQVDQATASDTTGIVQLVQLDPDGDGNTSKGLFRLATNILLNQVGNGTAVITA